MSAFTEPAEPEIIRKKKEEIYNVTLKMIQVINSGDYDTYCGMTENDFTTFEPESLGNLVVGMDFHRFYFENGLGKTTINTTILNPHIHLLGENVASISYIRLTQFIDRNGTAHTKQSEETRIWSKLNDQKLWKLVHLHRSATGAASGQF